MKYQSSETMRMIGNQYFSKIIMEEQINAIKDIIKAYPNGLTTDTAIDVFLLGFIYGKREERKKNKGNSNNRNTA